jgi:predicted transposase YdaD
MEAPVDAHPAMSWRELKAILNLSGLKQTRFYQEAKEEGLIEGEREDKL